MTEGRTLNKLQTPLHALIFDVDGTIADTERDGHRLAFNQAFQAAGLDWQWSAIDYGPLLEVAGGKERIRFFIEQSGTVPALATSPLAHQTALQASPGRDSDALTALIAQLHQSKNQHYKQLLATGAIPPRPGVRRLIQEARQHGIRLAIATTSAPENAIALLQTALAPDAPDWFEVIAAGDCVPAKKPAPDIYHYVLQELQLLPSQCLVIEDSYQGLQAARQAQLPTVVTVNDYTHHQDFTGAALVITQLGEPDAPFQVLGGLATPAIDWTDQTHLDLDLADRLLQVCRSE